jgi:hypothetical protein
MADVGQLRRVFHQCAVRRLGSRAIGGIVPSALCVGGAFTVATMAEMQEACRVASNNASRLMAAMTVAFAIRQIFSPVLVSIVAGDPRGTELTLIATPVVLVLATLSLIRPQNMDLEYSPKCFDPATFRAYKDGAGFSKR